MLITERRFDGMHYHHVQWRNKFDDYEGGTYSYIHVLPNKSFGNLLIVLMVCEYEYIFLPPPPNIGFATPLHAER